MMFEKTTSYRTCASLYSAVNDDGCVFLTVPGSLLGMCYTLMYCILLLSNNSYAYLDKINGKNTERLGKRTLVCVPKEKDQKKTKEARKKG